MARLELKSADARLGNEQADLGGSAALPNWATDDFTERWDVARTLAAQLRSRGVDAGQVYILLNALLPKGWGSNAGISLVGDAAARFLREMSLLGSALFTTLFTHSVFEAELCEPDDCCTADMASVSDGQGNEQANVFHESDCHQRGSQHCVPLVGVQPSTKELQSFAEQGCPVLPELSSRSFSRNLRLIESPYSRPPSHSAASRRERVHN